MKATIRIQSEKLRAIRTDLSRPHPHAWERVGFMVAAATSAADQLLLVVRDYQSVADADYVMSAGVGAEIGPEAFRKSLQLAYRPKSALIHVHTHHGLGKPCFSDVDLESGSVFVPSFFTTIPNMPQAMIVLSNNDAAGLLWLAKDLSPVPIDTFTQVGTRYSRDWKAQ